MSTCLEFLDFDDYLVKMNKESEIIDNISSYVLFKLNSMTHLKLQKLVYYVCALYYTFENKAMIHDDILVPWEAWLHGPANRYLHNKYRDSGLNYYEITFNPEENKFEMLSEENKCFIDEVLELFGKYDGITLETLTHKEDPWLQARGNISPNAPSNNILNYEIIKDYYSKFITR